jgi:D-sedoheptulose 7-phosphate isomerase
MMLELGGYLDAYIAALRRLDQAAVKRMAQLVYSAWLGRHTVYLCGNGGNAANAAHFATDLVKLTAPPRGPRLRAVALGESLSGLTAVGNDIAFEEVFAEQLRAFVSPNDIVIGLSTSGSSPNVLRAIEYANEAEAVTFGITGLGGQKLQSCARYPLVIGSSSVQQIEDGTMVIGHLVCLIVRDLVRASVDGRFDKAPQAGTVSASEPWAATLPDATALWNLQDWPPARS